MLDCWFRGSWWVHFPAEFNDLLKFNNITVGTDVTLATVNSMVWLHYTLWLVGDMVHANNSISHSGCTWLIQDQERALQLAVHGEADACDIRLVVSGT
jgi:hypothetical protein